MRRAARCVVLLGLIAGIAPSACREAKHTAPTGPPEVAPAFELPMLGADTRVELASLAGKTVVIDFWATWCTPCEFQVPALNAFRDAHRSEPDVALFGISVDTAGPDVVAAWASEKGVRYPILVQGEDVAYDYAVEGFPTVVVIRPDGTIDSRHAGLIQERKLEETLKRIRAEQPPAKPSPGGATAAG